MGNVTRIFAFVLIGIAVLLGIFAWSLARRQVPAAPAATIAQQKLPAYAVVVAARDLPAGKPIEPDALTVRMQTTPVPQAFSEPGPALGRVPLANISADTPLTATQLSSGLADAIAPGERAVSVHVDENNAVGNHVQPGNFVDVFFVLKADALAGGTTAGGPQAVQTQARLLLSKVRVLSFGDASLGNVEAAGSNAPARPSGLRVAVLAVRTADVDGLTLAENAGRLILALRNPTDPETAQPLPLPPYLTVVTTVAAGGGAAYGINIDAAHSGAKTQDGSARAAAGVSLDALAGARETHAPVLPPTARASHVQAVSNGLEVIRAGHIEKVAY